MFINIEKYVVFLDVDIRHQTKQTRQTSDADVTYQHPLQKDFSPFFFNVT